MKTWTYRNFALLASILMLFSCGKETTYTTRVNNYSDDAIMMEVFSIQGGEPGFIFLPPGESYTLSVTTSPGKDESIPDCTREFDSINVVVTGGKHLTRNIMDPGNWTHRMNRIKGTGSVDHFCDFDIHWQDLEY